MNQKNNHPNKPPVNQPIRTQQYPTQPTQEQKTRISRSAQNIIGQNMNPHQIRQNSAPIKRNNSRGEFTRQHEHNVRKFNTVAK
jgi:monomeric isocitrate dehydrogenase